MSKSPYVPFYTSDFLSGTGGMTAATKGVYITLLCMIYEAEGPIPQRWDILARRCGCTLPAFKKAIADLESERKVEVTDDGIWSEKCEKHITQRCERRSSAKAAAKKRWQKSEQKQGKGHATASNPQCQPEPEPEPYISNDTNVSFVIPPEKRAFDIYNEAASESGWPKAAKISKQRASKLKARLKDAGGLDGWRIAIEKAQASNLCCGQNDRGWTASLDFLLQESSFTKLMEGNYDNRDSKTTVQSNDDPALRAIAIAARTRPSQGMDWD